MRYLDIAEVAKQSGVAASALRFYEEKGLIASVGRRGLRRLFEPSVMQRLALIALGRAGGFTLREIAEMLPSRIRSTSISRDKLAKKAAEMESRIRRLTAVRDGLLHASVCKAPSHLECPKFQRLMNLAAKRTAAGKDVPADG